MEEVEKKKPRTSAAVKRRYNEKHYRDFRSPIKFEIADRIDAYIAARGISRSQFLAEALDRAEKAEKAEKEEKNF